MREEIIALIIAFLVVLAVFVATVSAKDANESGLKIKTIKHDNKPSEDESNRALEDFTKRLHRYTDGDVKKARVNSEITTTVHSSTRASGGITVELYCRDNAGYYMPVWGGSIAHGQSDWAFTKEQIGRSDIDGCYFGVVDSTAEMEAMTS